MKMRKCGYGSYGVYQDADYGLTLCREEEDVQTRHRLYRVESEYDIGLGQTDTEVKFVLAESEQRAKGQAHNFADPRFADPRPLKSQTAEIVPMLLQGWGQSEF